MLRKELDVLTPGAVPAANQYRLKHSTRHEINAREPAELSEFHVIAAMQPSIPSRG